jgi:glyoxylase-like metal-dependent hydrolase (beta-lactamase superfamily II)
MPSALRIYGERLEKMFGIMQAVPDAQLHEVAHGETVQIGDLETVAWFTPGHASHHVVWQVDDTVATGDVAGIRLQGSDYVVPPMPPPDIDVPTWSQSIDLLRSLKPRQLLLSHFGSWSEPDHHLDQLDDRLQRWEDTALRVVADGGGVEEIAARLTEVDNLDMENAGVPADLRRAYRSINPMEEAAAGLFRYASNTFNT